MKIRFISIFLLLLTFSAFGGLHDWDFEYWSSFGKKFAIGPVTPEQAKQALINWAGRQNLKIELAPIYYWREPAGVRIHPGLEPGGSIVPVYISWYAFGVQDPNPDNKYSGTVYVDSYTGKVMEINRGFGEIRQDKNVANMLPPQQALNLAKKAVLSYFPNIPIDSFTADFIPPPELTADGSSWEEYDDEVCVSFHNRFITPDGENVDIYIQRASVYMDSNTGEPLEVNACYEPLEISPIPTLSKEQIAQCVVSYFLGLGAEVVYIAEIGNGWSLEREEPNGIQRLYTLVMFQAIPSPDAPPEVKNLLENLNCCAVDGHTGQVFSGMLILPLGSPISNKPRKGDIEVFFNGQRVGLSFPVIQDKEDLYISFEDVKKMGFKLRPSGGKYIIYHKANKKNIAKIDEAELFEKEGEKYIKGKALSKLKGVITHYAKDTDDFHIAIVNEKAFQKGCYDRVMLNKSKGKRVSLQRLYKR